MKKGSLGEKGGGEWTASRIHSLTMSSLFSEGEKEKVMESGFRGSWSLPASAARLSEVKGSKTPPSKRNYQYIDNVPPQKTTNSCCILHFMNEVFWPKDPKGIQLVAIWQHCYQLSSAWVLLPLSLGGSHFRHHVVPNEPFPTVGDGGGDSPRLARRKNKKSERGSKQTDHSTHGHRVGLGGRGGSKL